ncbi:MAG: cache domain-containing protein [Candidatus Babeliales bacterium]
MKRIKLYSMVIVMGLASAGLVGDASIEELKEAGGINSTVAPKAVVPDTTTASKPKLIAPPVPQPVLNSEKIPLTPEVSATPKTAPMPPAQVTSVDTPPSTPQTTEPLAPSDAPKESSKKGHVQITIKDVERLTEDKKEQVQRVIPDVDQVFDDSYLDAKRQECMHLVTAGIDYFNAHTEDETWSAISDKQGGFVKGDLYLFVLTMKGICLAHGQESHLVWENLYDLRDSFGVAIVQKMIDKAKEGGGWVIYEWRNTVKVSYVRTMFKNGETYIIGAGYYPHSRENRVVGLVRDALNLFLELDAKNRPRDEVMGMISYPQGRFGYGDLFVYVMDQYGTIVAHGGNQDLIGINRMNHHDDRGNEVYKLMYQSIKDATGGVYFEEVIHGLSKKNYALKTKGKDGNEYVFISGYYEDVDQNTVVDLVRKAYRYMKLHGKGESIRAFSDKNGEFMSGGLYLTVYDSDGTILSDGSHVSQKGEKLSQKTDDNSDRIIRDILKVANTEGGWVTCRWKRSLKYVYVQKVNLGIETYILASGFYPLTKVETMILLVKNAQEFLENNSFDVACHEFVQIAGKFVLGDLFIFLFDSDGICYAYGDDRSVIWKRFIGQKDDDGRPYVKLFLDTVKKGPGKVTFSLGGVKRQVYVRPVEKDGDTYVIGSSYCL